MTPARLQLRDHVRASSCAVARSSEYGTVDRRLHACTCASRSSKCATLLAERAGVVVVVDDAEHALLRPRASSPACDGLAPASCVPTNAAQCSLACSGDASVGQTYGECCSRNDCGCAITQSPTHSTPRAASSSAYAVVWPGPPNDANALHLGRDLDRVGLGRDVVVGRAARLHRDELDLAAVELVVRGEVVDVLLRGVALLAPGSRRCRVFSKNVCWSRSGWAW